MRIVVSGTHASGKSTLIADFVAAHPEYRVLADPFDLLDETEDAGAASFVAQLRLSAARLARLAPAEAVIAERGPLDFLAYLDALDVLGRPGVTRDLLRSAAETTARAMAQVDLLVLLPLTSADDIRVPADEDPALREAMDDSLREFADDPDLTAGARVVEIVGPPEQRCRLLEEALD
jgi:hypothetical protein